MVSIKELNMKELISFNWNRICTFRQSFIDMRKVLLLFLMSIILLPVVKATCMVYFTGVGCPHCARTDPVIFKQIINKYNLTILEYEIYQTRGNAVVLDNYASKYNSNWYGIPLVIFTSKTYIIGDTPILNGIDATIKKVGDNACLLLDGPKKIENIDLNTLPGVPKVWVKNRVLIKGSSYIPPNLLMGLLFSKDPTKVLSNFSDISITKPCVDYSGGEVCFQHAVKFGKDWVFMWNGKWIEKEKNNTTGFVPTHKNENNEKLQPTLGKIVSLAAVDAINPCALAVLTLMLVAIMSYNPKRSIKFCLPAFLLVFQSM